MRYRKIRRTRDGRSLAIVDCELTQDITMSNQMHTYIELQKEIHDALREQHPEWVQPNGDCPTCESYESRFAKLLDVFLSNERKSAA